MHGSTDAAAPLTSTEAVLWMIERDPILRSTIMAVALLDRPVDIDRLHEQMRTAADAFPRLRQRVTRTRRVLCWTDVQGWDAAQHLTHLELPRPGTMRQVIDLAGEQAGDAFDPARPLWHLTLLDGVEGDRSALIVKMHHSMTDGVGGVGLMGLFTDTQRNPRSAPDLEVSDRPTARRSRLNLLAIASTTLETVITDPVAAIRSAPAVSRSIVKLLAPATRPLSPLATGRGIDRHLDVIEVPLRDLERAGHAVDCTVNDAFLAAIVGGLHKYHLAHRQSPPELRVTMPISVRREHDERGGNRFTPARFTVPLAIEDPARRMEELGRIAHQWRREPAVGMTDVLAGALSRMPVTATVSLFGSMLKGVDFVATNVPGPRERCWIAGAEVLKFYGFGPPSGSAMSVALVSHLDTCFIGIEVDTAAIDDPDTLRASLEKGFAEVVAVGRSRRGRRSRSSPPKASAHRPEVAPHTAGSTRAPRRLSALDASFLEAETPATPMHVGALMLLDGEPLRDASGQLRMDDIRAEIAARLGRSARMRQIVVPVPFARPVWQDDPMFRIEEHVGYVRLPAPGTHTELATLCCELQMRTLDRTRPLWEMWFVDGLVDGSVGLVYKVHHAVVDGVSAAETFELLLGGDAPIEPLRLTSPASSQLRSLATAASDYARTAAFWLEAGSQMVTDPRRALATAVGLGRLLDPAALAPHTTLNQQIGAHRRLVPVRFELAELKAVAHRHGATVNDVVLTLVGCGLREQFTGRGDPADHVRVLVPVSLRGAVDHDGVGNRVAALVVPLDISNDPVTTLAAISAETRSRKAGPEAAALDMLLRSADMWPIGLLGPATRQIVHHQPFVNLVVTNVRGAQHPLSLLGSRITEIIPVVPLGGNLSLGVAVLSYCGQLVVGLHADADASSDVEFVARGMEQAFIQLERSGSAHSGPEVGLAV